MGAPMLRGYKIHVQGAKFSEKLIKEESKDMELIGTSEF